LARGHFGSRTECRTESRPLRRALSMCRWVVYVAHDSVSLYDLTYGPKNSLIQQSFSATDHPGFTSQNNATLNADGVGLAWYKSGKPFLYKATEPAWCDPNLRELADYVESPVIFGHVRAASPGSIVNRENCHPFRFGRLAFQHNGHIEGFKQIKRSMIGLMTNEAFDSVTGGTDSEHMFALIVSYLPDPARASPFPPAELEAAIRKATDKVLELIRGASILNGFTTLNMAVTDGETVVATRFCDKFPQVPPPSLYFCYDRVDVLGKLLASASAAGGPGDGSDLADLQADAPAKALERTEQERHDVNAQRWLDNDAALAAASRDPAWRALIMSSEPLTPKQAETQWFPFPAQSMLTYTRGTEESDHRARPKLEQLCPGNTCDPRPPKMLKTSA